MNKFERILYIILIILIISLVASQVRLYATNRCLQVQVDTLEGDMTIQEARSNYLEVRLEYLTHPKVQSQRAYDYVMGTGEFKK